MEVLSKNSENFWVYRINKGFYFNVCRPSFYVWEREPLIKNKILNRRTQRYWWLVLDFNDTLCKIEGITNMTLVTIQRLLISSVEVSTWTVLEVCNTILEEVPKPDNQQISLHRNHTCPINLYLVLKDGLYLRKQCKITQFSTVFPLFLCWVKLQSTYTFSHQHINHLFTSRRLSRILSLKMRLRIFKSQPLFLYYKPQGLLFYLGESVWLWILWIIKWESNRDPTKCNKNIF